MAVRYTDLSDRQLVEQLTRGDEEAFSELYVRYWPRLKNFCRSSVRSDDVAEDYAQEVFARIWELREALDPEKSFSNYIYVMARNMIFNYLRHISMANKRITLFVSEYLASVRAGEADEQLMVNDYMLLLKHAIGALSPRQQEIFRMSRNSNMSHKQIAEQFDISVHTVQKHIADSLKLIKRYISNHSDMVFNLSLILLFL